jgi:hypothetical protein
MVERDAIINNRMRFTNKVSRKSGKGIGFIFQKGVPKRCPVYFSAVAENEPAVFVDFFFLALSD